MSLLDAMMDKMLGLLSQKKREEMMINMMPLMMEGIDMNKLMPRMMTNMLLGLTADQVIAYLKDTLKDREQLAELGGKIQDADLMRQMMFRSDPSPLGFEETVSALTGAAEQSGWLIPDTRDLQRQYHEVGLADMTRCTILYFCYPWGGYRILTSSDSQKPLSTMMPLGVSVYETADGRVEVAAMNLRLMSHFFSGTVREVLQEGADRYQKALDDVGIGRAAAAARV